MNNTTLIAVAKAREVPISQYKIFKILKIINGKNYFDVLKILSLLNTKSSDILWKLLRSSVSNTNLVIDSTSIVKCYVNKSIRLKRFYARAKGKSNSIHKNFSNITIELFYGSKS